VRSGCIPQPHAARTGAAERGLDRGRRRREAEDAGVSRCEGVGTAGRKSWGGPISNDIAQERRGEIHRRGAHVPYGPTLTWASANAKSSWRQLAGAMGGGTAASLR